MKSSMMVVVLASAASVCRRFTYGVFYQFIYFPHSRPKYDIICAV